MCNKLFVCIKRPKSFRILFSTFQQQTKIYFILKKIERYSQKKTMTFTEYFQKVERLNILIREKYTTFSPDRDRAL